MQIALYCFHSARSLPCSEVQVNMCRTKKGRDAKTSTPQLPIVSSGSSASMHIPQKSGPGVPCTRSFHLLTEPIPQARSYGPPRSSRQAFAFLAPIIQHSLVFHLFSALLHPHGLVVRLLRLVRFRCRDFGAGLASRLLQPNICTMNSISLSLVWLLLYRSSRESPSPRSHPQVSK
jgi:hypothetical protein